MDNSSVILTLWDEGMHIFHKVYINRISSGIFTNIPVINMVK